MTCEEFASFDWNCSAGAAARIALAEQISRHRLQAAGPSAANSSKERGVVRTRAQTPRQSQERNAPELLSGQPVPRTCPPASDARSDGGVLHGTRQQRLLPAAKDLNLDANGTG